MIVNSFKEMREVAYPSLIALDLTSCADGIRSNVLLGSLKYLGHGVFEF